MEALFLAVQEGGPDRVEALLRDAPELAATPDSRGQLALHWAAEGGHTDCVETLLRAAPGTAATPDGDGWLALHLAAEWGHTGCVEALLRAAPETAAIPERGGDLALHYAASSGHTGCLEALLRAAPETAATPTAAPNGGGDLALQLAVWNDCTECVEALLRLAPPTDSTVLRSLLWETEGTQLALLCLALLAVEPLGAETWQRIPIPLPGLCSTLSVCLERSDDEAAEVVRRMSASDRERLQAAALALGRSGLPDEVTRKVLGLCFLPVVP